MPEIQKSQGMPIRSRERKTVSSMLKSPAITKRFEEVLGKRAPQFCSSIISISQQKHLANCQPESVLASAMVAATLNLPVNPTLGLAYIVPYGGQAQFQIGYKGLVQLAIRSGQYRHLNTFSVYEGQIVRIDRRTGEIEFDDTIDETGDPIGFGAYLETVNGYRHTVYWSRGQVVDHAKRFSQAFKAGRKDSPWLTDFDSMAKKTVLKSLLTHWGPLSVEIETAVTRDMTSQAGLDAPSTFDDAVDIDEAPPTETTVTVEEPAPAPDFAPAPTVEPTKRRSTRNNLDALQAVMQVNCIQINDLLKWASENVGEEITNTSELPKPMIKGIVDGPDIFMADFNAWKAHKNESDKNGQ